MGKDFEKELSGLNWVYEKAMTSEVNELSSFLRKYSHNTFLGVGSGGSLSTAYVFEYLCAKAGWLSKSITPLEVGDLDRQIKSKGVILFTASGRNVDSKNAYKYIEKLEPEGVLVFCMHKNAPIKSIQNDNLHNYYYEYEMPVLKDGYLAVESLVSSMVILIRSFELATIRPFFNLPRTWLWRNCHIEKNLAALVLQRESIVVLHSGITSPAAYDMESKFSEASLGNVHLADFRNFAHGRHYWLSDRKESTAVVAMVGNAEKELADMTLRLIPKEVPIIRIDVADDTAIGLLESFDFAFELTLFAGQLRGINPGKPKIESFGRSLYHLSYNFYKVKPVYRKSKDLVFAGAYRKAAENKDHVDEKYLKYSADYYERMRTKQFRGIIFDYDGTLHNKRRAGYTEEQIFGKLNELLHYGIRIGIATGRGKSARIELRERIKADFWQDVIIAYYNGGCIGALSDERIPNKEDQKMSDSFIELLHILYEKTPELVKHLDDEKNPYQISLIDIDSANTCELSCIREIAQGMENIKMVESSHSIDFVPRTSSKNNIFSPLKSLGYSQEAFLVIGDAGQFGGNDYELLQSENALSVDYVSKSQDFCWNYAELGLRNLEATLFYLNRIIIKNDGSFYLRR